MKLAEKWTDFEDPELAPPAATEGIEPLLAVPLMDLFDTPPDPALTLLGDRFLCVGGAMMFIGPSGIGKSSASVQKDILWALGRPAFGISPARPLKTLCIQAENDAGDVHEMARGVCAGLGLSDEDRVVIRSKVLYVSECGRTGPSFLSEVIEPLLDQHRPDILRLDPLLAYVGADVNNAEAMSAFLRTGLNPLLKKYQCAAIINHHTPKIVNRDTSGWRPGDWGYAGMGSSEITNWPRAILVIDPTHEGHVFRFIAAKRGGRIGWCDETGQRVFERLFCHQTSGGIFWREPTDDDVAQAQSKKPGRKVRKTKEEMMALVPMQESIAKNSLLSKSQSAGIGEKNARGFLAELLEDKKLYEWKIPRPKTNRAIRISRHEQTLV